MSLKFFADHCVPTSICKILQNAGFEILVLRENLAVESPDELVIAKAQELKAILISLRYLSMETSPIL